jgi:ketosteroid isomerase-like protein
MRSRLLLVVSLVSLVAVRCAAPAPPPPPPGPDLAAEERAIRAADAQWLKASQAKDAAGEAAVIASDAMVYRANENPIAGPAAFQAYAEKTYKENPKMSGGWTTDKITVAASGDMAVQTGTYNLEGLGPKGDVKDAGKFVTVWKKVGGAWKVAYDVGSTTMPDPKKK